MRPRFFETCWQEIFEISLVFLLMIQKLNQHFEFVCSSEVIYDGDLQERQQ